MSNWFTCSKPGDGVWWCWWWWWWCINGAFIWWGVRIIVLCGCWLWLWRPFISIPTVANELLLCVVVLLLPGELWCKSFVFCSSESLQDSDDPFFTLPGFDPLWVFTCFAKWSDLMNLLLQTGHANLLNGKRNWKNFVNVISGWKFLFLDRPFLAGVSAEMPL